jgi:cytochrome b561/polyisoprenoid-binding protein YceI
VTAEGERAGAARYATIAIVLHWLIAAAIVLQVVLSSRMEGRPTPESFAVTQLHKSVGVTILLLSLLRLGWRLLNPPPPLPPTMARWERALAHATHIGLYAVMLGMPLTGWIMVSTSRIVLPTLLYWTIPWPMIPGLADLAPAAKRAWHEVGEVGHGTIIKFGYVLLALHVAGALKHQLFSRDEPVLGRMAPGARPGRWREPRLAAIVLAFVGIMVFGALVQPPRPAAAPLTPRAVAAEPIEAQAPAAATPAAPADAAVPTGAVRWVVAPGSSLGFGTSWGGEPIRGRFNRWTADILFGPDALDQSKVTVSVDLASVDTGDQQRDASLPSGDWFDVATQPKAVFTATRFSKTGEDRYVAHGTLKLRGVTKPMDLPFRLIIDGDRAQARGRASLDRNAFGVGQGEFAATDQIPGKVTLDIDVKAKRAP